ncbi:MAG TPA: hypothetical protein VGM06_09250 [Polyangiaceae bacterium]|jgi:hypothetical protein
MKVQLAAGGGVAAIIFFACNARVDLGGNLGPGAGSSSGAYTSDAGPLADVSPPPASACTTPSDAGACGFAGECSDGSGYIYDPPGWCASPSGAATAFATTSAVAAALAGVWVSCSGAATFARTIDPIAAGIEFTADGHYHLLGNEADFTQDSRDTTLLRLDDPSLGLADASAPDVGTFDVVDASATLGAGAFQVRLTAGDGGIHVAQVVVFGSPVRIRFFTPSADDYAHALTKAYQANVCGPALGPIVTPDSPAAQLQGRWARCDDGIPTQDEFAPFFAQQGLEFEADGTWHTLVEDPTGALVPTTNPDFMGTYTSGTSQDDVVLNGGEVVTPQFDACGGMVLLPSPDSGPTALYRHLP